MEEVVTSSKLMMNDKFQLINIIFSDELSDLAIRSEDTSTRAKLDAGLVGHKSQFWTMVESHFNEGLPPGSVDGMTFGDSLHWLHPLFHSNETMVDPLDHGQFPVEKLLSVCKDMLKEYDTVMVNYMKSGNHDRSFTRAAMIILKNHKVTLVHLLAAWQVVMMTVKMIWMAQMMHLAGNRWLVLFQKQPTHYHMWLNKKPNLKLFVSRQILLRTGPICLYGLLAHPI
jgi:hypothetical protein